MLQLNFTAQSGKEKNIMRKRKAQKLRTGQGFEACRNLWNHSTLFHVQLKVKCWSPWNIWPQWQRHLMKTVTRQNLNKAEGLLNCALNQPSPLLSNLTEEMGCSLLTELCNSVYCILLTQHNWCTITICAEWGKWDHSVRRVITDKFVVIVRAKVMF